VSLARKRVLVVYSRVGGGHLSAARALAQELESTGRASTRLVDAYLECSRFPVTLFPAAYARVVRNHPRLWWLLYYGSDTRLDSRRILGPFLRPGLNRLVAEERPDLVVSVLPVINGLLAEASASVSAPLEVVLTDWHSVHRLWVARGVRHYTAPTDSARMDCIGYGASPAAIDVAGIPVRRGFATPGDRQSIRTERLPRLGLAPDRFTIVVMVGAEGSPRALRNLARLAQMELDAQIVVICGRNDDLRQHVARLAARVPVRALGFVDDVADLMCASDVLVTKAGGLTLAEAFCRGVPVVVHDVLAGQEAANLEYVLRRSAVEYAPSPAALTRAMAQLYSDPARRAALAERGSRLARPRAAVEIARNVLRRLG
jgi:UDP-N-acetylglucosamine:LPS N-acetylglucosamine transferase